MTKNTLSDYVFEPLKDFLQTLYIHGNPKNAVKKCIKNKKFKENELGIGKTFITIAIHSHQKLKKKEGKDILTE